MWPSDEEKGESFPLSTAVVAAFAWHLQMRWVIEASIPTQPFEGKKFFKKVYCSHVYSNYRTAWRPVITTFFSQTMRTLAFMISSGS
jgi:hypothetical protein